MPYKDPEKKRLWEAIRRSLYKDEINARRRELRNQSPRQQLWSKFRSRLWRKRKKAYVQDYTYQYRSENRAEIKQRKKKQYIQYVKNKKEEHMPTQNTELSSLMPDNELLDNLPNAAKLIASLRHLDYNNITALADLTDNAIDAGATRIWITIEDQGMASRADKSTVSRIVLADNGSGMTRKVLDEALKLGSNLKKNQTSDLGYSGMGLITASIAMGTRLEVITKESPAAQLLQSVQDLGYIMVSNRFVKTLKKGDKLASELFNKYLVNKQDKKIQTSGTVVIVDKIDNCQWKSSKEFTQKLLPEFGRIYRKFLQANAIHIFINGQKVQPIDPIYDFEPNILCEEDLVLPKGKVHIKVAELKDYGHQGNRDRGITEKNSGFYILRNDREILSGQTLGLYVKHGRTSNMRIELSFPATLDSTLSSNFSKSKIILGQHLSEKIGNIIFPHMKKIIANRELNWPSNQKDVDLSDIESLITKKHHLLKTPELEPSVLSRQQKAGKTKIKTRIRCDIEKDGAKLNLSKKGRPNLSKLKVQFKTGSLGEKGPLYNAEKDKDKVLITWNIVHPFYTEFIQPNMKKPQIITPLCFLIYSLANAELIAAPDSDSMEIIENIRWDTGRNLAILLKS